MLPRQEIRSAVRWHVQIRAESGLRTFGYIVDLSTGGCCIAVENKPPRLGSKVIVRPDGIDGLEATVQWINGRQFGAIFARPIYGPVLEHFVRKHSTFASLVTFGV